MDFGDKISSMGMELQSIRKNKSILECLETIYSMGRANFSIVKIKFIKEIGVMGWNMEKGIINLIMMRNMRAVGKII